MNTVASQRAKVGAVVAGCAILGVLAWVTWAAVDETRHGDLRFMAAVAWTLASSVLVTFGLCVLFKAVSLVRRRRVRIASYLGAGALAAYAVWDFVSDLSGLYGPPT